MPLCYYVVLVATDEDAGLSDRLLLTCSGPCGCRAGKAMTIWIGIRRVSLCAGVLDCAERGLHMVAPVQTPLILAVWKRQGSSCREQEREKALSEPWLQGGLKKREKGNKVVPST